MREVLKFIIVNKNDIIQNDKNWNELKYIWLHEVELKKSDFNI